MAMYHRENAQEGFLVVAGECVLIVEEMQRWLVAWDFFHCPPKTNHVVIGGGDTASVVVAFGARGRGVGGGVVYPICQASARYGASVERETSDARKAYAMANTGPPRSKWIKYRDGWLPQGDE